MIGSFLRDLFASRTPARRTPAYVNPLRPPEVLESRSLLSVTTIAMEPLADTHLTSGATNVAVLQFTAKSTDWRAGVTTLHLDDVNEGTLSRVANGTLYWESSPGTWTPLDSSPVSVANGRTLYFSGFGKVPTGDLDGARFQVRVNALPTGFTPVHAELGIIGLGMPYGGTRAFASVASSNGEEVHVPTSNGYQRTLHNIVPLADTSVTALDRDKVVFEKYVYSSDPRAYARCLRLVTKDASPLPFINTASLYVEIGPGVWDKVMTVRPNGYGQLIFTFHEKVGRIIRTSGAGAHIQVRVDANPLMTGTAQVNVAQYLTTMPNSGRHFFASYVPGNGNNNPPTHGQLSVNSMFFAAQPGTAVRLADMNIGVGSANAAFDQLTVTLGTGSWTSATNITLRRLDGNGNPTGPALGSITSNDGTTIVITGINSIIGVNAYSFGLFADITNPLQITSVSAIG